MRRGEWVILIVLLAALACALGLLAYTVLVLESSGARGFGVVIYVALCG